MSAGAYELIPLALLVVGVVTFVCLDAYWSHKEIMAVIQRPEASDEP